MDLRRRVRDRSPFLLAHVAPFSLAAVFSLVSGGIGTQVTPALALADRDGGPAATAFAERALRPLERDGVIRLRPVADEREARAAVERATAVPRPVTVEPPGSPPRPSS
ncbi:hypothetical protein Nocox_29940 [Nonomuraea coxensis DSM 45129]|uniref:ABC transporter permease n=1 Tax=Nonomuraea coxensis DSM 45129 TaxID=1122611 RepID=A0ABX8UA85_9ACTN|nr:hypothetical protein [Nonomuraea coxensis]QYC43572.1 hypothetical protein Nocox_29940 [Nonomuraea coxensis DSM 45129]